MPTDDLTYRIQAEDKFTRTLRKGERQTERVDRKTNKLNRSFSKLGKAVGGLAIGAAFTGAARSIAQTTAKVQEFRRETTKLTGAQGGQLDLITAKAKSVADTYDKDYKQVLEATNAVAENFGITQVGALEKVNKSLLHGGSMADDFLEQVKEYGPGFKEAGFKADQFFKTIEAGAKSGVFKDKLPDAIKEFGISIKEQTKPAKEALIGAFGEDFTEELFDNVAEGEKSVKDALSAIDKKLKETDTTAKDHARIVADLFKGPGEDIGANKLLSSLDKVTSAMSDQRGEMSKLQQHQKELQNRYEGMASAQNRFARNTEEFGNVFSQVWAGIKETTFGILDDFNKKILSVTGQASYAEFAKQRGEKPGALVAHGLREKAKDLAQIEDSAGGKAVKPGEVTRKHMELLEKRAQVIQKQGAMKLSTSMDPDAVSEDKKTDFRESELWKFGLGPQQNPKAFEQFSQMEAPGRKRKFLKGMAEEMMKQAQDMRKELKFQKRRKMGLTDDDDGGDGDDDNKPDLTEGSDTTGKPTNRTKKIASKAPDSIEIRIDNLLNIDEQNVAADDPEQAVSEIKDKTLAGLLEALNDAQTAQQR